MSSFRWLRSFFECQNSIVGQIASTNARISCVITGELLGIIRERKDALSMTESRFGSLVFDWWFKQGCPAVTPADEAMMHLAKLKVAESGGKHGKK